MKNDSTAPRWHVVTRLDDVAGAILVYTDDTDQIENWPPPWLERGKPVHVTPALLPAALDDAIAMAVDAERERLIGIIETVGAQPWPSNPYGRRMFTAAAVDAIRESERK